MPAQPFPASPALPGLQLPLHKGINLSLSLFCFLHRAELAPHASGGYFTARSRRLFLWRIRKVNLNFASKRIKNHR